MSLACDGVEIVDTYVLERAQLECGLLVVPTLISIPTDGNVCAVLTNLNGGWKKGT